MRSNSLSRGFFWEAGLSFVRRSLIVTLPPGGTRGIMRSSLCPRLCWIHCIPVASDDVVVDAVLGIRWTGMSVEALRIRFIFGEECLGRILAMEPKPASIRMLKCKCGDFARSIDLFYDWLAPALIPGPGVAEPNCRQ